VTIARRPADRDPELEQIVRRRRGWAAIGELRAELKHYAVKYARQYVEQPGPSTWVCHVCDATLDPVNPAALHHRCNNCHTSFDQDVNNCRVRLSRWRASGAPLSATRPPLAAN
jgi:hypothetical protein